MAIADPAGKYIVDTNVPTTANRARSLADIPPDEIPCIIACIEATNQIREECALVLDASGEIFDEYRRYLSFSGQPGVGDAFMRWVHDNIGTFDRVEINRNGNSYHEFPNHDGLAKFDHSDRKFVAVANAHPEKPPILQGTDSKWMGWGASLAECGITVEFVCLDYVKAKFHQKMEK